MLNGGTAAACECLLAAMPQRVHAGGTAAVNACWRQCRCECTLHGGSAGRMAAVPLHTGGNAAV